MGGDKHTLPATKVEFLAAQPVTVPVPPTTVVPVPEEAAMAAVDAPTTFVEAIVNSVTGTTVVTSARWYRVFGASGNNNEGGIVWPFTVVMSAGTAAGAARFVVGPVDHALPLVE
jgi:hypothetical protein